MCCVTKVRFFIKFMLFKGYFPSRLVFPRVCEICKTFLYIIITMFLVLSNHNSQQSLWFHIFVFCIPWVTRNITLFTNCLSWNIAYTKCIISYQSYSFKLFFDKGSVRSFDCKHCNIYFLFNVGFNWKGDSDRKILPDPVIKNWNR